MKCPLLLMAGIAHEGEPRCPIQECLHAWCAWWDDGQPGCAILTIATELATIRQKGELEVKLDKATA